MKLVLGLLAVNRNVRWYVLNGLFHNAKQLLICSASSCRHEGSILVIKLGLLLSASKPVIRIQLLLLRTSPAV
jgi:hypothetical protein